MTDDVTRHWIVRLLFRDLINSRGSGHKLGWIYFSLAGSIFLTAAFGFIVSKGPRVGLPDKSALVAVAGKLAEARKSKGNIYFSLADLPERFRYNSKAGDSSYLFDKLQIGSNVVVWHEPFPANHKSGDRVLEVFQVETNGVMARSYEQVERSWLADNALSPWMLVIFALMAIYFATYIFLAKTLR